MDGSMHSKHKKNIIPIFIFLCIVVVTIIISVIVIHNNNNSIINTNETINDQSNPVSSSTEAMALTESIKNELNSDPDFTPEQAISEYEEAVNESTDDLKVFIAIEYSQYVYESTNDLTRSVNILNNVKDEWSSSFAENEYLNALLYLYKQSGDTYMTDYYTNLIAEKYPANVPVYDQVEGEHNEK